MPDTTKKIRFSKRNFLLLGAALLIAAAGLYWYIATEKFSDTKERKADFSVDATAFINEFVKDSKAANEKYTEKIVVVNGVISATEMADSVVNIKMSEPATGSYIIFAFQEQHLAEAKQLKAGDLVSIKGSCSGGIYSDILGFYSITFKRSTLNK